MIETNALRRVYGGLVAVAGVDLAIPAGELRAVIGPNGAGKTTLFNLLSGRVPASSGRVLLDGVDVTGWTPERLSRQGLARTFQITSIFPGLSVRENVRVAAQSSRQGLTQILGSRSSLIDVNDRTDETLETLGLGDRAHLLARQLAYGDQRLLEIGLALATTPRVILLDEPMAGMSAAETHRATEIIRGLAGRLTVLLIEHDMDVVLRISDRISVMHQGRVIAEGTAAEIQASAEVQEAYLGGAE